MTCFCKRVNGWIEGCIDSGKFFFMCLKYFYKIANNYGVAIIFLTLLIQIFTGIIGVLAGGKLRLTIKPVKSA